MRRKIRHFREFKNWKTLMSNIQKNTVTEAYALYEV